MLTKFDVRSPRVKSISFHPELPWVLCGLHNGTVQIYDYLMKTTVDTFSEHEGSVRGVDFHKTQPLFVTGGDDTIIRVWNYKLRRCLFTLTGHTDIVRTTFFHHEQPWILSCSDDLMVRLWNWQSRSSVACLPGHTHYVMCAQFHPQLNLVVSGSLDKTVRVWDISPLLRPRHEAGLTPDLLGTSDAILKCEITGHQKGVNWVAFHPTNHLGIVSASDDCHVLVWDVIGDRATLSAELRGHTHNVCCVTYFRGFILSCSEDRSIIVWGNGSSDQRSPMITFRLELDRYWILATHPKLNLIAAGHDSGLQVFKLAAERLPFAMKDANTVVLAYSNYFKIVDLNSDTATVQHHQLYMDANFKTSTPRVLACEPGAQRGVVLYGGNGLVLYYDLTTSRKQRDWWPRLKGVTSVAFYAPNKVVFTTKDGGGMFLSDAQGQTVERLQTSLKAPVVFAAPPGYVLCHSEASVVLLQVAQKTVVAEAPLPHVKYVVWDKDFHKVALLAKNSITVLTRRLKPITAISEPSVRVKSAAFNETRNLLYYSTSNHIKCCNLLNGEVTTVYTLPAVVYLIRASGEELWGYDREGKVVRYHVTDKELLFRLSLQQQSYRDAIKVMRQMKMAGQALVGYLHKHGFSEIALHFVTEPLTRFNLAIECGAMDIAQSTAAQLNDPTVWSRLADMAVKTGNVQLAQTVYLKAGQRNASALLALVTGNLATLGHLVDQSNDDHFRLQYGLYLNDVERRVQLLVTANQLPLAYRVASANGLDEAAQAILQRLDADTAARLMQHVPQQHPQRPATTVPRTENWPLLSVEKSIFALLLENPDQANELLAREMRRLATESGVDGVLQSARSSLLHAANEDDAGEVLPGAEAATRAAMEGGTIEAKGGAIEAGGGWGDDLDVDLDLDLGAAGPSGGAEVVAGLDEAIAAAGDDAGDILHGREYVVPTPRPPISRQWAEAYTAPACHIAAGAFDTALALLRRQIGLQNAAPLKPYMRMLWTATNVARPAWLVQSSTYLLSARPSAATVSAVNAPALPHYLPVLQERSRTMGQLFVEGRFADAKAVAETILHQLVVTTVREGDEAELATELREATAEYARALTLQLHLRSAVDATTPQALQLALYFTHFRLAPAHLALALLQAMVKAYKSKHLIIASLVARRLLEVGTTEAKAKQARAIIAEADRNPTSASELDYDPRTPFVVCSVSHVAIKDAATRAVVCGYCASPALAQYKGQLCPICGIAALGAEVEGLDCIV